MYGGSTPSLTLGEVNLFEMKLNESDPLEEETLPEGIFKVVKENGESYIGKLLHINTLDP